MEYSATAELTPSDKGIQAAEVAGRRLGQFGQQIDSSLKSIGDKIENHMAVMETSELYKTGTELKLNLQQKYEKEAALPENRNDPHFGDRFMSEVGPMLDQWGSGAQTDHGKQLAATLKASIRNEIFNHVTAGQMEMDSAHVFDNAKETGNLLGSGLITDPSEINLNRSLGTMKDTIDGMTMAIPDVGTRERVAEELREQYMPNLVIARYRGIGQSITNQIAATGGETSPAAEQMDKDIATQVGFQYLKPEQQVALSEIKEEAIRRGQELYKAKNETAKSQLVEQGKSDYSQIYTVMTQQILSGKPPTPELVDTIGRYATRYGATNPSEVASLNEYLLKGSDRAQEGKIEPYSQQVRDSIQSSMSLPSGDPRRPTLPSLTQAWSNGQITKEDLGRYTEILTKLDKPDTDPTFKPAWENLKRWQEQMVQSIGNKGFPGTAAARAQFIHDSTAAFMTRGKGTGDWDKTLDTITNAQNNNSFGHAMGFYQKASQRPDAANWLQQHDQFDPHGLPVYGSQSNPIYPTAHPAPAQKLTPGSKEEKERAQEILWGHK